MSIFDLNALKNGVEVMLIPNSNNPLHKEPVKAVFDKGYFHCEGDDPVNGPSYYHRDVFLYNTIEPVKDKSGCWTPERGDKCDCPACGGFND